MREAGADSVVTLVIGASLAILVTSLLILLLMMVFRMIQSAREERNRNFIAIWRPIMAASIEEPVLEHPPVLRFNYINFLMQWNLFMDSLRGQSRKGLIGLARETGMDQVAIKLLGKRSEFERTIAAMSLGNMGDKSQWDKLKDMAENNIGLSGQVAARALARIDPLAAVPILVPLFIQRREWPESRVVLILKDLDPNAVSIHVASAIFAAPPEQLPRLLRLLPFIERGIALQVLSDILASNPEPEVLSACLAGIKTIGDYQDIDLVKKFLDHEAWTVRVQAVNAMGLLARSEDLPLLIDKLADPNWWVRYRSAQAICNAPFVSASQLEDLRDNHPDRYARNIMAQVMAEKQMAVE